MTLLIVIIVFGGMVFLHEFGHFMAARFFKIQIEEFGFGFPPRLLRFWRDKGSITISGQQITIPNNFNIPFDTQSGLSEAVIATADSVNGSLILRTIELASPKPEDPQIEFSGEPETDKRLLLDQLAPLPNPPKVSELLAPQKRAALTRGEIEITGHITALVQGTEFTLNWLPIGGFVRPKGENDPNVLDGLAAANPWKRLGVLFAGPVMNLITAIVVMSVIIAQTGIGVPGKVLIESVSENSPAQQAGIQTNDILVTVSGKPVSTLDEAKALIRAGIDTPLEMTLERSGKQTTVTATPLSSRPVEQGALGVGLSYPRRSATIGEIVGGGFLYTGVQAAGILYMPIGLIQGAVAPGDARLIGMKGIYDIFGQAVQRDTESRQQPSTATPGEPQPTTQPTNYILSLIAMLSISLAVFNLLPIPALDGGRILFTLPEILFRRRIPYKLENVINGVAMLLLIALMVFINAMDFINPVNIKLP
jgi:regulator of sigma E protease